MRGVYLLHFDRPYRHARHYTGYAADIDERIARHRRGDGARLLEVLTAAGIGFTVARTWPGADRRKERRLKRSGGAARYCPVCQGRPLGRGEVPAMPIATIARNALYGESET